MPTVQQTSDIFSLLIKGRTVVDDTLFEKFQDWFRALSKDQLEGIVGSEGFHKFLQYCLTENCSSGVCCVGLGCAAWTVTSNTPSTAAEELLTDVIKSSSWSDPGVKYTWLKGLQQLMSNGKLLLVDKHEWMVSIVFPSLWDSSLFVLKSAEEALGVYLLIPGGKSRQHLLQELISTVRCWNSTTSRDPSSVVYLLKKTFTESAVPVTSLTLDEELLRKLIKMLGCSSVRDQQSVHQLLAYHITNSVPKEDIPKFLDEILQSCGILSTLKLVSQLMISQRNAGMENLVVAPLTVFRGGELDCIQDSWTAEIKAGLDDKTRCSKLLLQSLSAIPDMVQSNEIDADLVYLLKACLPRCPSEPQQKAVPNRNKVLTAALNALTQRLEKTESSQVSQESGVGYISALVPLLKVKGSSPMTTHNTYRCIAGVLRKVNVIQHQLSQAPAEGSSVDVCDLLNSLADCVLRNLCDLDWEVRDSAIHFVTELCRGTSDPAGTAEWLVQQGLHNAAWQGVEDGESYVRASALHAVQAMPTVTPVWNSLLSSITWSDLLNKVLNVLKEDTEAFARRAAVDVLHAWFKVKVIQGDDLDLTARCLIKAATDSDWEVKLKVLHFVEDLLECWYGQPLVETDSRLLQSGDQQKAGLEQPSATNIHDSSCHNGDTHSDAANDDKGDGTRILLEISRLNMAAMFLKVMQDHDQTVKHKACLILSKLKPIIQRAEKSLVMPDAGDGQVEVFLDTVRTADFDRLLSQTARSTDEYFLHPDSVLDDMLRSLQHEHPVVEPEEQDIVDCY